MEIYKKSQILSSLSDEQKLNHQSKHLLLELYRCDREKLNDESFLRCTLNRAAKLAQATVLRPWQLAPQSPLRQRQRNMSR